MVNLNLFSSELVDKKIEDFLLQFEEKLRNLSDDEFETQVRAMASLLSALLT